MKTELKPYTMNRNEFLNSLNSEIDLVYFLNNEEWTTFEEARDIIEEGQGFNIEVIYYHNAIEYLSNNDHSLSESIELATELGFNISSINSELLASLLASQKARQEFEELESDFVTFLDEEDESH